MATPETEDLYPASNADYATPPGDTLRDRLEYLGMTQAELATRTALSPKHINQVLTGVAHLSPDVAHKLELATGIPSRLWNRLEADYRSTLTRLDQRQALGAQREWLKLVPMAELVRRGALPPEPTDRGSRVQQLLAFFGVATTDAWEQLWLSPQAAFRQSAAFTVQPGAVAAWLRLGEIKSQRIECEPFDPVRLRAALPAIRALTLEEPSVYGPALKRLCADCGVAVVFIKEITGSRVSGAARWVTPNKAIVQLSGRYGTDDHLWFTLFHEVGHVLMHGKRSAWVEDESEAKDDPLERDADRFAQDVLIPAANRRAYEELQPRLPDIRAFAKEIGIAPGIIVGRLQREKRLSPSVGNRLKRHVQVAES